MHIGTGKVCYTRFGAEQCVLTCCSTNLTHRDLF